MGKALQPEGNGKEKIGGNV
jgi:hypothetical protein